MCCCHGNSPSPISMAMGMGSLATFTPPPPPNTYRHNAMRLGDPPDGRMDGWRDGWTNGPSGWGTKGMLSTHRSPYPGWGQPPPPTAHPEAGPVLLPPSRARSAAGPGAMPVPGAALSRDSAPGCGPKWR